FSDAAIKALWDILVPFSDYAFNKAHTAGYGLVSYWTAYLKANYPAEYMTADLSADMGNAEKVAIAIAECRRMGITVRPPDINASRWGFVVSGQELRFGLGAIKNVGQGAVEDIVAARTAGGPFRSLDDLCARIDLQRSNKRVLESLIKCGACDAFGPRAVQLERLDGTLATAQREQKDRASGQVSLFDLGGTSFAVEARMEGEEAPKKELLAWEKELLGIYVSDHPLQAVSAQIGAVEGLVYLAELKEAGDDVVIVAGVVTSARKHITQKKALMLFAQLEDLTASTEVTVFPRTYEATHQVWNADEIVLVVARVEQRDDQPKLLAEWAVPFSEVGVREIQKKAEELRGIVAKRKRYVPERPAMPVAEATNGNGGEIVIRFRESFDYGRASEIFRRISAALSLHAGPASVYLELPRAGSGMRRLATQYHVRPSAELADEISRVVGPGVVDVVLPKP
ncbi:MAG TPA: OB-fold nucleic acid binding domain-containing protein, partial [Candidatus Limnocylindria bacterium]|nr:OB-fold nucleic acid binding domain-containing protein [Candidatus Limnocylindria bacterium]